jgi:hypothetical protein
MERLGLLLLRTSRNGAPLPYFVEMIAEARAYPSAVYQGISQTPRPMFTSVPGDPANSCSKTSGVGSPGFWSRWPPLPRQRDRASRCLRRCPFMIPLIDQWLITPAVCCSPAITATQWLVSKLKAACRGTCSRITFFLPNGDAQVRVYCSPSMVLRFLSKATPHALSHVRSKVLRDRHIRVKSPALSGEKKRRQHLRQASHLETGAPPWGG